MKTFKNLILLAFMILESVALSGQGNTNLLDPGKMWSSVEWSSAGGFYYKTYYNCFLGDTTIGGISYTKILQAEDEAHSEWYLYGFIREDVDGNIFGMSLSGNEGLIYNFDLNPGDTLTINNSFAFSNITAYVTQVDTIVILPGGMERKRITLIIQNTPEYQEHWIEGVGSEAGILWSGLHALQLTGGLYDLSCHWENETLVFNTNIFSSCFVEPVSVETSETEENLSVYPLPVTSQSIVQFHGIPDKNYQLEIWNTFGQKVLTHPISINERMILSHEQMKSGVYIIVILNDYRVVRTLKFSII